MIYSLLCYVRSASQGRRALLTCIFLLNKPLRNKKKISLEDDVFGNVTGFRVPGATIRDKPTGFIHQEQYVENV